MYLNLYSTSRPKVPCSLTKFEYLEFLNALILPGRGLWLVESKSFLLKICQNLKPKISFQIKTKLYQIMWKFACHFIKRCHMWQILRKGRFTDLWHYDIFTFIFVSSANLFVACLAPIYDNIFQWSPLDTI